MKEKKYIVIDDQECGFMSWTHDEPVTELEFREHVWSLDDSRANTFEQFDLDYILPLWCLTLEEVK